MVVNIPKAVRPIFIKPLGYPGGVLTKHFSSKLQAILSFRSLNLETDLEMLHSWVNSDYAIPFWQFNASKSKLFEFYYDVQRCSCGHSYIGLLNGDPICQLDVYQVIHDELNQFIVADEYDCGFHLLMAPNKSPIHGLTLETVRTFLNYFFRFPQASRMFGEPDIHNKKSNLLLQKLGFRYMHQILMSYKTATLYSVTKTQFYEKNIRF
jgi:RimJ/RimL family protein N-acetyltransferase